MGVKLRARGDKGWYVLIDWMGQRKAKCFGENRSIAKEFADKLAAKLKWAEQSGEPISLASPDGTMPTVAAYLQEWLTVYADAHCKPFTTQEYRKVVENISSPPLEINGSRM